MSKTDKVDEQESKTTSKKLRKDSDSEEEVAPWSKPETAGTAVSAEEDREEQP